MADQIFASGTPSVVPAGIADSVECDIAIIGAGVGGATLAWALRESGARILVVEQGDFLPRERENWSPTAIHRQGRYKNSAYWIDAEGKEFQPGNYHYVGGSSKLYGATMPRFREDDFEEVELLDGTSPAWPISYAELEPY
jgi:choline dehydrogenase-like flavoprotein